MIGVGVIGYGYAGKVLHCPLIAQTEGLRLTAVASRDASRREQARQQWNVPVYERPEELLADKHVMRVVWGGRDERYFARIRMSARRVGTCS